MLKRIVSAAIVIAAVSSAVAPANAQVDPQKVANRKEVIHGCLLRIYLSQKKRPLALSEYAIMVGMKPTDPKLRYEYGVYILQGNTPADYNAALTQLKKAVELDPSNFEYNGTVGAVYTKLKNPEEALKWYGKAIQYGGGEKYKKLYQDLQLYMQQKKQYELQKKQVIQQKKQQEQQKKQQNPDGTKKSSDDDDDDW